MVDENYIDKRFREELKGLEANPPVEAWLAISDALDKPALAGRSLLLTRVAAALAVFVVAAFSFWMLFLEQGFRDNTMVQQTAPSVMDAVSSSGIPQSINTEMLLADLALSPESSELQSALPLSETMPEKVAPERIQPFSAKVSRQSRPLSMDHIDRSPKQQTLINLPVTDLHLYTEDPKKSTFASNVNLGAHFAFQYNYRTFANQASSGYRGIPFNALESQIYTFSAGLNVSLALSSSWGVQTGLHVNNMGQYVEGISAYQHPDYKSIHDQNQIVVTSLGGVLVRDTYHHFSDHTSHRVLDSDKNLDPEMLAVLLKYDEGLTQVFQFIEVPLILKYKRPGQHVNLHFKGGMATSYLLNKDVYLGSSTDKRPIGQTQGLRQINFSVIGGFVMQVPVAGRFYLNMEPTAQLFLHPVVQSGLKAGQVLPYNFSIQTGVSYRF